MFNFNFCISEFHRAIEGQLTSAAVHIGNGCPRLMGAEHNEFAPTAPPPKDGLREPLVAVKDPALWVPKYGEYDRGVMGRKLDMLAEFLQGAGSDPQSLEADYKTSADFIERVFREYEAKYPNRAPGSFAFVVPTRTRREVNSQNDGYMNEWLQLYPIIRHVSSDVAQRFIVGTPPFIIDKYGRNKVGRTGYMLLAPFFSDMAEDIKGKRNLLDTSAKIMQDTFNFAQRLGITTIGLGATLPGILMLMDRTGVSIDSEGLELTTGHAGTVWLIGETLKQLAGENLNDSEHKIGIIGAGSIGTATLHYLREGLGFTGQIQINDTNKNAMNSLVSSDSENVAVEDVRVLIEACGIVICAVTKPMSLKNMGVKDLTGTYIIDDSQPGCFDAGEVTELGGQVVWVIGKDPTEGELTCQSFDYSGYGPAQRDEVWGCQLEAWAAHQRSSNGLGSIATRGQVTFRDVLAFSEVAAVYGATLAPLQVQGHYVPRHV